MIVSGCHAQDKTTPLRYLALGDSYTIGESVAEEQRWPVQLAKGLQTEGIAIAMPEIIARTGWTTDELADGIDRAKPEGPYDLVSVLIGVNNQYRGRDIDEYRAELRNLLEQAKTFAGGREERVFVVSIPDWGVMPFAKGRDQAAIAEAIDIFNQVKLEEAEAAGIRYIDITPISRRAAQDTTLVASDGLHPSGTMYTLWVEQINPSIKDLLIPR